jgi:hypothetical protein
VNSMDMKLPDVSKQELLDAIRDGVSDAMWQMITNATSEPCADFYETVRDGVETAISKAMPFGDDILTAISHGVEGARGIICPGRQHALPRENAPYLNA